MTEKPELHVNGKWLAQKLSGTQRYAGQVVEAMAGLGRAKLIVHVPADAEVPEGFEERVGEVRRSGFRGVLFEQLALPWATRGRMLLNLAGPAPLAKRRQVVAMHDATPFRYSRTFRPAFVGFYFVMYFLLARTARQVVTVSSFSAGELAHYLRVPADRFLVAYCAADALVGTEPVRPDLDLEDNFYLSVGTQAVNKNLAGPISAIADSGRQVVVVGFSGDSQVYTGARAVSDRAVVPGFLDDEELVWLYRNAKALVFPSKYEGFGLPPLEAQTLGCAVVSSNAASMPEVCADGALFFDPDDYDEILSRLSELEADPSVGENLRERGEANTRRFTWTASAERILDAIGYR